MEKRTANIEIKQKNRTDIFRLLRNKGGLSRQDIVTALHLSLPTVTQNLSELMEEGLVEEAGSVGNTGGRRARSYAVNNWARTAVGLDITQNHISAAVVDMGGRLITHQRIRHPFARTDEYAHRLAEMVDEAIVRADIKRENILGVGIGVPGLVSDDHETVIYGETLNFTGADKQEFAKYIPFPTALYHDVNAACFAEIWQKGDIENVFYVMLNNSIGGAIYVDHKLYEGDTVRAGELGHITVVPNGRRCYCGRRGCVDAYCSSERLSTLTDGNLGAFFERLKQKDPKACELWNEYIEHLTTVLNISRVMLDCNIILGGYVGAYIDDYMNDLRRLTAEKNPFEDHADYLLPCKCKVAAVAMGAALNYISAFVNTI